MSKTDPTQTELIRGKFEKESARRLNKVCVVSRALISAYDGFRFSDHCLWPWLHTNQEQLEGDSEREIIAAFMLFMSIRMHEYFIPGTWHAPYITSSYYKSVQLGLMRLQREGFAVDTTFENLMRRPDFQASLSKLKSSTAGYLSQAAYDGMSNVEIGLRDYFSDMRDDEDRIYTDMELRRGTFERIENILEKETGLRAAITANTAPVEASAEGILLCYSACGITHVRADVEFATAADDRVCDICAGLAGQTYTIQEARGIIPVHARCRCSWLPV